MPVARTLTLDEKTLSFDVLYAAEPVDLQEGLHYNGKEKNDGEECL